MDIAVKKVVKSSEVGEKATRRRFSQEYKERIVAEADRCMETGQLGALLRREGIYSSNLSCWRRQLQGHQVGTEKGKGKKRSTAQELARLKRENERLTEQLRQAELIIEVQKKVSDMMQKRSPEKTD